MPVFQNNEERLAWLAAQRAEPVSEERGFAVDEPMAPMIAPAYDTSGPPVGPSPLETHPVTRALMAGAVRTTAGQVAAGVAEARGEELEPYLEKPWQEILATITGFVLDPVTYATFGLAGAAGKKIAPIVAKKIAKPLVKKAVTKTTARAVGVGGGLGAYEGIQYPARTIPAGRYDPAEHAKAVGKSALLGTAAGAAGAVPYAGLPLEIGAFAAGGAALEGRLPTEDDWIHSAGVILGLRGVNAIGRGLSKLARGQQPSNAEATALKDVTPEERVAIAQDVAKPTPKPVPNETIIKELRSRDEAGREIVEKDKTLYWKQPDGSERPVAKRAIKEVEKDMGVKYGYGKAIAEPEPVSELAERAKLDELLQRANPEAMPIAVEMERSKGKTISPIEIIRTMEHDFDIPIRTGRFRKRALGLYKWKPEVARLAVSSDVAAATHEVAHHIDKTYKPYAKATEEAVKELARLDYEPAKARPLEGFAEFIRHFLTEDNAAQVAPKYHEHFVKNLLPEHPKLQRSLAKARDLVDRLRQQGAVKRVQSQISKGGEPARAILRLDEYAKEWIADKVHKAYFQIKDEGHYLSIFGKELRKKGYAVREGAMPYAQYLAMTQAGPTLADTAIQHGVYRLSGNLERIGPSLVEVFKPIQPGEYKDFMAWAYARHARESWDKGKNPGISRTDADWVYERLGNDRWEGMARGLTDFNNALILMLADVGVISADGAKAIINEYQTYLPLHRAKTGLAKFRKAGKKLVDLPGPLKRRFGSGLQIVDPLEATIERAVAFYTRASKQVVSNSMIRGAREVEGMGHWIEAIPPEMRKTAVPLEKIWPQIRDKLEEMGIDAKSVSNAELMGDLVNIWQPHYQPKGQDAIVRHIEEGKPKLYKIDRDLHQAVTSMDYLQLGFFGTMMNSFTKLAKLGMTGLSAAFAQRNPARDFGTWFMQTKAQRAGRKAHAKTVLRALPIPAPGTTLSSYVYSQAMNLAGKKGDPYVEGWQQMGGELANWFGLDQRKIRRKAQDIVNDSTARRTLNITLHPVDAARSVFSVTEGAPRIAESRSVLEANGYTPEIMAKLAKEGKRPPLEVQVEATNAASDVTTNFKRQGALGKYINRTGIITPFFNAALESLDKYGRAWRDQPTTTLMRSMALASASLAYWYYRKDDDDYKEMPPWLKYGFWTLTDNDGKPVARVPRPFEWGWTMSAGVEAIANTLYEENPEEMGEWAYEAITSMLPGFDPILFGPIAETAFNYDLFRDRPIVTDRLMSLKPEDQHYPYTTELSKDLGRGVKFSPARLEHLFDGLTGGLYSRAARAAQNEPGELLGKGAFTLRKDYTRSTDEFYEEFKRARQAYNSAKLGGKTPPDDLALEYQRFNFYNGMISDVYDLAEGVKDQDERFKSVRYIVGLARASLNKEPLDRYPNPLVDPDAPPKIQALRKKRLGSQCYALSDTDARTPKEQQAKAVALAVFDDIGLSQQDAFRLLHEYWMGRGWAPMSDTFNARAIELHRQYHKEP